MRKFFIVAITLCLMGIFMTAVAAVVYQEIIGSLSTL